MQHLESSKRNQKKILIYGLEKFEVNHILRFMQKKSKVELLLEQE